MSLTVNKASSFPVSEQKTADKSIRGDQPSTLIEKLARILVVILFVLVFIPDVNPARIFTGVEKYSNEKKAYISEVGKMNINLALFTSATNYETTVSLFNDELTKSRIKVVDEEGKAVKDENGKVVELKCTYDPTTGRDGEYRAVKGTIHWVSTAYMKEIEVRNYDKLFVKEDMNDIPEDKDYKDYLNPESLKVVKGYAEPALVEDNTGIAVQFERVGYFHRDPDSTPELPVYNKTTALKDSFKF